MTAAPYWAAPSLAADQFERLRRRTILEHCKWDPQVGDTSVLGDFPLLLRRETWAELTQSAELLAQEAMAAELELLRSPELHRRLSIPRSIRRALAHAPAAPALVRVLRFDFHFTARGWRISEVNSDVPGGFTEASSFTSLMAEHYRAQATGRPIDGWADAIARAAGDGIIALLSAPGFMEDLQIVSYLGEQLKARGCRTALANPDQIRWNDGCAQLHRQPLGAIVRFYQAEWLAQHKRPDQWRHFFSGGRTPVFNPGSAVLLESKRFPLVWDALTTPLPTWRALLPETRDPRDVPWRSDEEWVLKAAFSNTGDAVAIRPLMAERERRSLSWQVRLTPWHWVAQRRFDAVPVSTPLGPLYVCIGVYTIDGHAIGAYTRASSRPLIDYRAIDLALLISEDGDES